MANYRQAAAQFARQYGLKPGVFVRQIQEESGFRPHPISPAGARGIAQFMPGTAAGLGVNPDKPMQALQGAAKLMSQYVHKYGNYRDALVAYNAGPGRVGKALPGETQRYIATILGGSNPSAGGATPGSSTTTTTSTTSIAPAADQARRNALAQFVLAGNKADPLSLAENYAKLSKQTQTTTRVTSNSTPGAGPSSAAPASSGAYPLGRHGKVIGTPFAGTHAKAFNVSGGSDNWQSENAVDISIPVGTPVYAVADGVLGNTGSLGEGGRFAGLRTNLIGKGNSWYYAHMSKLGPGIRAGAHVRKGQLLGYSGEANGVAHLHFAQEKGDPRRVAGR